MIRFLSSTQPKETAWQWNNTQQKFHEVRPGNRTAAPSKTQADLNGNGKEETYTLRNGLLTVGESGIQKWSSPKDWQVTAMAFGNVMGLGQQLVMVIWKPGDYGASRPFWVKEEENDISVKNHLFVYNVTETGLFPAWQSSNLDTPNCSLAITDADADGQDDLIVLEGSYQDNGACKGHAVAVWTWSKFNFFNVWRSEKGSYHNLHVVFSGSIPRIQVSRGTGSQ